MTPQLEGIVKKVIEDIKRSSKSKGKTNHTLIVGDRGSGKTTALRLIYKEVKRTEDLNQKFNSVFLPFSTNGQRIKLQVDQFLSTLEMQSLAKRQILFLDDLHLVLDESKDDAHFIRGLLQSSSNLSLIASSDLTFRNQMTHDKAFYGFFRVLELGFVSDFDEIVSELREIAGKKEWMKLNEELAFANPFWVLTITGGNLWLLSMLKMVVQSLSQESDFNSRTFIKTYFDITNPFFLFSFSTLPKLSRYFLEEASLLGEQFRSKDIDLNDSNTPQEALKLLNKGYLEKDRKGVYRFRFSPLKAWIRYTKHMPLGLIVSEKKVAAYPQSTEILL
tara:strand:- start:534 stop:1532 length:999 start_codon:yes stop_codon:yes gene_type:complete